MKKPELTLQTTLAANLDKLIRAKAERDQQNFNPARLAKAIQVNRSIIQRLLNGEVENPRTDTLVKIANFFINDGFNLRVDDLLGLNNPVIDVREQALLSEAPVLLPLYSLTHFNQGPIGNASTFIHVPAANLIAAVSDQAIGELFQAGSLFIIDTLKQPKLDNIIAVQVEGTQSLLIGKYVGHAAENLILRYLNTGADEIESVPELSCNIIGIVIRVNAKT